MKEDHGNPMNDRDDVATLVRLAGKRRAVPRDRTERVKAAARAQWQLEVQRRSRKRYVWAAAGLATAASLVLLVAFRILLVGTGAPTVSADTILVESLAGPAWSRVNGENPGSRALEVGDRVNHGSELATAEESRAAIRLASGHSVRLAASTTIRLLDEDSIGLDRGSIYVDSGHETASAVALEIHTPLGVVQEIGTQFEVRLEHDSIRLRLREGAVVMHHDDQSHRVQVGTELVMDPDGSVTRRPISPYGPDWEWIVGITPMLDLEGRSARTFLDWVARERGWTLAFADESVARSAADIVLSGTVERLTLEQALDAVLPTCRMTYRVEKGVLLIAADAEDRAAT